MSVDLSPVIAATAQWLLRAYPACAGTLNAALAEAQARQAATVAAWLRYPTSVDAALLTLVALAALWPEGSGDPTVGREATASVEVSGNGGQPATAGAPPATLTEPSNNGEVAREGPAGSGSGASTSEGAEGAPAAQAEQDVPRFGGPIVMSMVAVACSTLALVTLVRYAYGDVPHAGGDLAVPVSR